MLVVVAVCPLAPGILIAMHARVCAAHPLRSEGPPTSAPVPSAPPRCFNFHLVLSFVLLPWSEKGERGGGIRVFDALRSYADSNVPARERLLRR